MDDGPPRDLKRLFAELGMRKYGQGVEGLEEEEDEAMADARYFRTWLGGWVLVLGSLLFMSFFLYSIVVAKLLPLPSPSSLESSERRREWMDVVRDDEYFCLLVPLTLAPATVMGYLNWLAMEFYRAN